jgi:hypothetical protein
MFRRNKKKKSKDKDKYAMSSTTKSNDSKTPLPQVSVISSDTDILPGGIQLVTTDGTDIVIDSSNSDNPASSDENVLQQTPISQNNILLDDDVNTPAPIVKERSKITKDKDNGSTGAGNAGDDGKSLKTATSSGESIHHSTSAISGTSVKSKSSREGSFFRRISSIASSKSNLNSTPAVSTSNSYIQQQQSSHSLQNNNSSGATGTSGPQQSSTVLPTPTMASAETQKAKTRRSRSAKSIDMEIEIDHEKEEPIEVNYDVNPTLLYKFIEYKDWDESLDRIKDAPEESKVWVYRVEDYNVEDENTIVTQQKLNIRWRMLPLHVAIIFNAPIKVVMALYKSNPEGIMECDDRKMLPIHLACRVVSNVSVAQFLIYKSSKSLHALDYKGRTPLDILKEYRSNKNGSDGTSDKKASKNREALIKLMKEKMQNKDSQDVQVHDESEDEEDEPDFVLEEYKNNDEGAKKSVAKSMRIQRTEPSNIEPTKEVDYDSYPTVLIKLIERKMWEQAITRCVEVPQEASTWMCRLQEVQAKKNAKNEVRWKILPLHSAIVLHAPVEVIEALVDAYPQGLRKGDDRQMLPLHMAFRLGSSPETAAVLVDAYPEALKKKDSRGHTPLHILKAYRRKYIKDEGNIDKNALSAMDTNRRKLIKFYLGGRRYGHGANDDRLRKYDSDSDSEYDSDSDDSYNSGGEEGLFYKDMFSDFARLTSRGITSFPYIMRDTLACRGGSYDLGA